jgi:hypothetical protein
MLSSFVILPYTYHGMYLIDRCFKHSILLGFTQDGSLLSIKIFRAIIMNNERNISLTITMYNATKSPCYATKSPQQRARGII